MANTDTQIIVTTYMDLTADYLRRMPQLEAIIATTISTHFIDSIYCREHHIQIFNSENYTGASVAEHAVALMMSAMRKIPAIDKQIRQGNADCFDYVGTELAGKTVGIIGFGNIGSYVAQLLSGFNMHLQYYNRSNKDSKLAEAVTLETLLKTSDMIFLTTPLNHDSHHIINTDALKQMKSSAILVNISPDDVMDMIAVKSALEEGEIGGAAMDLLIADSFRGLSFSSKNSNLEINTPNTVLTSRRAWFTIECFSRRIELWKKHLLSICRGSNR